MGEPKQTKLKIGGYYLEPRDTTFSDMAVMEKGLEALGLQDRLDNFFGLNGPGKQFSVHQLTRFFQTPRRASWLIISCYRPSAQLVKGGEVQFGRKGEAAALAMLQHTLGSMQIGKVQEVLGEVLPFFLARYMSLSGFLPSTTLDLHNFSRNLTQGKTTVEQAVKDVFGVPDELSSLLSTSESEAGTTAPGSQSPKGSNSTSNSTSSGGETSGPLNGDTPKPSSRKPAPSD